MFMIMLNKIYVIALFMDVYVDICNRLAYNYSISVIRGLSGA